MRSPTGPLAMAILTLLFASATLALGWWIAPVVGAVWAALVRRRDRPELIVAIAAPAGWIGLLIATGVLGPVGQFANLIELLTPLPRPVLYAVVLGLASALAWTGAIGVNFLRRSGKWTGVERRDPTPEQTAEAH